MKDIVKDTKVFLKTKKEKKLKYRCERYKNLSEDAQQKLVDHFM